MRTSTQPKPGIKLPDKPKFRSLVNKSAANYQLAYVLERNSENPEVLDYAEDFVVGLGHLKYRSLQTFAAIYGENLQVAVSKCIWFLFAAHINSTAFAPKDKDNVEELYKQFDLTVNERINAKGQVEYYYNTPYGELVGDPQDYIIRIAVFILCQYGRITDASGDGTFDYVPVTEDQIFSILDPQMLFDMDEDGTPYLLEIFEIAGLWDAKKLNEQLEEQVEEKN
jgi:hypothetical protein